MVEVRLHRLLIQRETDSFRELDYFKKIRCKLLWCNLVGSSIQRETVYISKILCKLLLFDVSATQINYFTKIILDYSNSLFLLYID